MARAGTDPGIILMLVYPNVDALLFFLPSASIVIAIYSFSISMPYKISW